ALRPSPNILAHPAVDLVLCVMALGHRVLIIRNGWFEETRPPLLRTSPEPTGSRPKRRPEPRVAKRCAGRLGPRSAVYLGVWDAGVKLIGQPEVTRPP